MATSSGTWMDANARVLGAIVFYCICSSSMLVVNKLAIHYFRFPNTLLTVQFLVSSLVPKVLGTLGLLDVDGLEMKEVIPFCKAVVVFFATLFTSMKALQVLNVDTVTVFRSSLPLAVAVGDYLFLARQLPSCQTWTSLILTLAGSVVFIKLEVTGLRATSTNSVWGHYFWGIMYWMCMVSDQLVLKHVVDQGPQLTTWGRVYYQNTLSMVPAVALAFALGEVSTIWNAPKEGPGSISMDVPTVTSIVASCVVGCGISFSGFLLRQYVSALSFTVIGVVNKLASVGINMFIWDKHASPGGLAALSVCVLGATLYRQPERIGEVRKSGPSPAMIFLKAIWVPGVPLEHVRVTIFRNGGGVDDGIGGKCLLVDPAQGWEAFAQLCADRLELRHDNPSGFRFFNVYAGELDHNISLLRDDEVIFVSTGEPFRRPHSSKVVV